MRPRTSSGRHAIRCAEQHQQRDDGGRQQQEHRHDDEHQRACVALADVERDAREHRAQQRQPQPFRAGRRAAGGEPEDRGGSQKADGGDHLGDHLATLGATGLALARGRGKTDLLGREACERLLIRPRHYTEWSAGRGAG